MSDWTMKCAKLKQKPKAIQAGMLPHKQEAWTCCPLFHQEKQNSGTNQQRTALLEEATSLVRQVCLNPAEAKLSPLEKLNALFSCRPDLLASTVFNHDNCDTIDVARSLIAIHNSPQRPLAKQTIEDTCRWVYEYMHTRSNCEITFSQFFDNLSEMLINMGELSRPTNYMLQMCLKLFLVDLLRSTEHRYQLHIEFWMKNARHVSDPELTEAVLLALHKANISKTVFVKEQLSLFRLSPQVLGRLSRRGSVSLLRCYALLSTNTLGCQDVVKAVYDVQNRVLMDVPEFISTLSRARFEELLEQIWIRMGQKQISQQQGAYVIAKLILDVQSGEYLVGWLEKGLTQLFDWLMQRKISEMSFRLILNQIVDCQHKFSDLWAIIREQIAFKGMELQQDRRAALTFDMGYFDRILRQY